MRLARGGEATFFLVCQARHTSFVGDICSLRQKRPSARVRHTKYSPVDVAKHGELVALQVVGSCSVLGWVASPLRDHLARADRLFVQLLEVPRIRISVLLQIAGVRRLTKHRISACARQLCRPVCLVLPSSCPRIRTAQAQPPKNAPPQSRPSHSRRGAGSRKGDTVGAAVAKVPAALVHQLRRPAPP